MSDHTDRAVVRADRLLALAPFTSSEESRPYLQGIEITPASGPGCILAATDGTVTVAMHDYYAAMTGIARCWRIPTKKLLVLLKLANKQAKPGTLWCELGGSPAQPSQLRLVQGYSAVAVLDGEGFTIGTIGDEELGGARLKSEEAFPDWRSQMVNSRPETGAVAAWIDADALAKVADLAKALDAGTDKPGRLRVAIHCGVGDRAARISILGFPEVAVMMQRAWPEGIAPIGNPNWIKALVDDGEPPTEDEAVAEEPGGEKVIEEPPTHEAAEREPVAEEHSEIDEETPAGDEPGDEPDDGSRRGEPMAPPEPVAEPEVVKAKVNRKGRVVGYEVAA